MRLPKPEVNRIRTELWAEAANLSDDTGHHVRAVIGPSELVPGVHATLSAIVEGKRMGISQIIDLHSARHPEFTERAIKAMSHRLRVQIGEERKW